MFVQCVKLIPATRNNNVVEKRRAPSHRVSGVSLEIDLSGRGGGSVPNILSSTIQAHMPFLPCTIDVCPVFIDSHLHDYYERAR